jgi:subtilisin family serine protease
MKRAAVLLFVFLALPEVTIAATQRVLVATRHPAAEALARMRGDDFDPSARADRNLDTFKIVNGFVADLDESEIAALRKSPEVLYVEPDAERHAFALNVQKNDATFQQMTPYGISLVHAPQAWVAGRGAGINVVIIDTGIDYHHPDLAAVYAGGMNFTVTPNTTDPFDDAGHGTHVAGTIAAADDAFGVVGVAPQVRIWSAKVLGSDGTGNSGNIIKALDWIVSQKQALGGNWIASLSLGSCFASSLERAAFARVTSAGVLVVAAAGNHDPTRPDLCSGNPNTNNSYVVSYPAAYDNVVAVAAVDFTSTVADFSNFGPQVSIAAPGVDVVSTWPLGSGALGVVTPAGGSSVLAPPVTGTPVAEASGAYVFCGLGKPTDFPASVKGKIALIKRGDLTFHDKVKNAIAAGATSVVIFNKDTSRIAWTLIGRLDSTGKPNPDLCNVPETAGQCHDDPADLAFPWPLTVGISLSDGQALVDHPVPSLTIKYHNNADYAVESGTSMATPHVTGVAAAVWSMAPGASVDALKSALLSTAHDLGDPGLDNKYGYGLVDAEAAGRALNPSAFNPQPATPTGRRPGKRGR